MKFADIATLVGGMGWFDLPLLVQAFPDRRPAIRLQLSRWIKQGKVIALRRGMYTLSDETRKVRLDPAILAQHLCRPSYLSGVWALGFHDMIPERVVTFTNVTTRLPTRFDNAYGVYEYRHIKQAYFFGYEQASYGDSTILVARPEKALLDHWYLSPGEWTTDRLVEMRYQHWMKVNHDRLREAAERFHRPRLQRAAERWVTLAGHSDEGTVTL